MAKDVRIIPASGEINFNENGVEKATVYQLGNDIHIAPIGTIYLGDGTAANLQLGDEATSVDIQFLGGGTITSTGGTLSVGSTGDVVNLNVSGVTYNLPQINAQSLQGYVPSNFALSSHVHTVSNITGLQDLLVFEAGSGYNSIQNALPPYTGTASGMFSMAVFNSNATATGSVAIGGGLNCQSYYSTAFGLNNSTGTNGGLCFVAGGENTVSSSYSAALGGYNTASGYYSAVVGGFNTASGYYSFVTGGNSNATGAYDVAMGFASTASGGYSVALGATANGQRSFASASGYTTSSAYNGISMGYGTMAQGQYSVAIGGSMSFTYTDARGDYSIAMGAQATASGRYSTAIGAGNVQFGGANPNALGDGSIAMGMYSTASGYYSTALQGGGATGNSSFAINGATASGYYAVAISSGLSPCNAAGEQSFAIGVSCQADAPYSGVIGNGIASHQSAIVINTNSNRDNAVFVNELSIMNIPTDPAGLPYGAVWVEGDNLKIVL